MNQIEIANHLTAQRVVRQYLSPLEGDRLWTVADACVTARQIGNRSGVPADASTWRYGIQYPDGGWSMSVRAVWRMGDLFRPSTHVAIEDYYDDEGAFADSDALRIAVNDWLRSLPL